MEFLYCLTHVETLSIWNIAEVSCSKTAKFILFSSCLYVADFMQEVKVADFPTLRESLAQAAPTDYFISCSYEADLNKLFLFGGTFRYAVSKTYSFSMSVLIAPQRRLYDLRGHSFRGVASV
jgi:hypothetical protein